MPYLNCAYSAFLSSPSWSSPPYQLHTYGTRIGSGASRQLVATMPCEQSINTSRKFRARPFCLTTSTVRPTLITVITSPEPSDLVMFPLPRQKHFPPPKHRLFQSSGIFEPILLGQVAPKVLRNGLAIALDGLTKLLAISHWRAKQR